ncbi:MAG: hypothetical protein NWF00_03065 [Candidatus Bathyarchaeota archaeon]|nr:hypothetical protein [Candidatus Bathyarchaeota archaeon]
MKALVFAVLVFLLLPAGFCGFSSVASAEDEYPVFAMPVEWVNYTIVNVDGELWTKIDGYYPISIQNYKDSFAYFPMFYPVPPQTTNITCTLNGNPLPLNGYSSSLHHTAIGDWEMALFEVGPVADSFVLTIHYTHPLQMINGSYLFLYDLNISPYLTEEQPNSTIYYTINFCVNATNIQVYTTKTDTQWNPINFTQTQNDQLNTVSITQESQYQNVLGDLVVMFNAPEVVAEFPAWILMVLIVALTVAALGYSRSRVKSAQT